MRPRKEGTVFALRVLVALVHLQFSMVRRLPLALGLARGSKGARSLNSRPSLAPMAPVARYKTHGGCNDVFRVT